MPDNLDHSSWMWNEHHSVPLSPVKSHLFSVLHIVQMWIVMMDGGILPGIFKQCNLIWCINPLLNLPFTVWTDQNNSSANTYRYDVATGSRTPCNRFDLFCEVPNSGAATSRDLNICLKVIELGLQNSSRPLRALPPTFSTYSQTIQIKANDRLDQVRCIELYPKIRVMEK